MYHQSRLKFYIISSFLILCSHAKAQSGSLKNVVVETSTKQNLVLQSSSGSLKRETIITPIQFLDGSSIKFVSSKDWSKVGDKIIDYITNIHFDLSKKFGEIKNVETNLELMDSEIFYLTTKTPRWTNAMFYQGQIIVPVNKKTLFDLDNLERSIRHEYTHSVIHGLSNGKCPGWIDEGMAQISEGTENYLLYKSLLKYIKSGNEIHFKDLQGGFTKLKNEMVAPAYSFSLVATKLLINKYGYAKLKRYFEELKDSPNKNYTFVKTFGINELQFERIVFNTIYASIKSDEEPQGIS